MHILYKTLGVLLLLCFTVQAASAQKQISAKDKEALIKIFEDVDPDEFIMWFDNGKERYGKKRIKMEDLKMDEKWSQSAGKSVKWTFIVGDRSANEVVYIYTEGMDVMVSLLGKKKFKALMDITSKYKDLEPTRMRR